MAFNFSGMMRGLGGGLVASGKIMEEQNKLNWDSEQTRLKYEREQHLEKLRNQNENIRQQAGFTHAENLQTGQQTFLSEENRKKMEMEKEQFDINAGMEKEKIGIMRSEAGSTAAARSRAEENDAIRLEIMKQESQAKIDALDPKKQEELRKGHSKSLIEAGVPEKAVAVYVSTGTMPQMAKDQIPITAADLETVKVSATNEWETMSKADRKSFSSAHGVKTDAEGLTKFKAAAVQQLFLETGRGEGPSAPSGALKGLDNSDRAFIEEFKKKTSEQQKNYYMTMNPQQKAVIDAAMQTQ